MTYPTADGACTILVVDDDSDILQILKDNLALDGYHPLTVSSGKDSLSLMSDTQVDLMVLDLMLPDMDGLQVCRAVRQQSDVPIIMLTAKDSLADKVLGLESGADDYLVKPFDYLELAARIKACLRRCVDTADAMQPAEYDGVCLDPAHRTVSAGKLCVQLTRKEYDIFQILLKNAGRVLERETIRKEIWPDEKLYKWSRTIDVHIQHLRKKLDVEKRFSGRIVTVPGVGYKLDMASQ